MIFRPRRHRDMQRRTSPIQRQAPKESSFIFWLKNLGLLIAVLSATGALFGYGVALGLSARFGMGTGAWYTSALELISLSGEGIIGMMSELKNPWDVIKQLAGFAGWYALLCAVTALAFWLHDRFGRRVSNYLLRMIAGKVRGIGGLAYKNGKWHWLPAATEGGVVALVGGFFGFALIPVMIILTAGFTVFVALIPSLGMFAGTAYANSIIEKNLGCVSSPAALLAWKAHRATLENPPEQRYGAHCIEVSGGGNTAPIVGRIVVSRPQYLVLYVPSIDTAVLVPIRDANIRAVPALHK